MTASVQRDQRQRLRRKQTQKNSGESFLSVPHLDQILGQENRCRQVSAILSLTPLPPSCLCSHSFKCSSPFELSAPQNVVLAIHDYREKLVFPLSDGVRLGGYCLHFL